jgi:hypothetical protein
MVEASIRKCFVATAHDVLDLKLQELGIEAQLLHINITLWFTSKAANYKFWELFFFWRASPSRWTLSNFTFSPRY